MFEGVVQIGGTHKRVVAPFEYQDSEKVCVVSLGYSDIAQHWSPGSVVRLTSLNQRDQVSVVCYDNGLKPARDAMRVPNSPNLKIPTVFEVVRGE